jgi:hypothetical protein
MCDYSLHLVASRPAKVGDELITADFAKSITRGFAGASDGWLAGPRVYSYEELLRTIARIAGLRPVLMRMPFALWDALAGLAEMLPQPPLTCNQVELMQIDSTAADNRPGFGALGISPRSLEKELQAILQANR